MSLFPAGTILELGPPHFDPNAPNIKHTMTNSAYLVSCSQTVNHLGNSRLPNRNSGYLGRPIISIGHASPAAEAAALAGAAETARAGLGWRCECGWPELGCDGDAVGGRHGADGLLPPSVGCGVPDGDGA